MQKDSRGRPAARPPVSSGSKRGRWALRGLAVLLLASVTPALVACGGDLEARSGLGGAYPSAEAATQAALDALQAGDRAGLEALLLTREEHRTLVWNEMPEKNYFSFDYVRFLNEHNTRKAINRAMDRYRGQDLEVVSIAFEKETEEYSDFRLHRGAKLTVRRASDGVEGEIDLVDVFVERNGGWKPMNFVE
ncbi:MAG: hypothetical protein Q8W46_02490 [Candidatus Palauibacterales bacterium]|nr:hypothetical protein [Candidatus Palauibacterales bacterium]